MPSLEYAQSLIEQFRQTVEQQPPFNQPNTLAEEDAAFLSELQTLTLSGDNNAVFKGQQLVCKVVARYPHLTPLLPRDLLWLLGGDCLHYMPDEEIAKYQLLEELEYEAERDNRAFDFARERNKLFGLH